jgi:hypothetical protein
VSLPNRGLTGKKIGLKNEGVLSAETFADDTLFVMMIMI